MRRAPAQLRSTTRFESILDTTAALIAEVGYADLTISLIAKRAGMSTAAIYRYFDDLSAISRALAARNLERYVARVAEVLGDDSLEWEDAIGAIVDTFAEFFRDEPGFRWLRLGDSIDRFLISSADSNRTLLARHTCQLFFDRYEVDWRVDLLEHVEVMVEIAEALVGRAFQSSAEVEEFYIAECRRILVSYLGEYLARPHTVVDRPVDWMTQRPSAL
jgi:AcrR family transcriptional regulator